jgi:hypothetical protein
MADLTKASPSLATMAPDASHQLTLPAAADIAVGDMVYINSSGQFAKLNGTSANAAAQWYGMVNRACKSGEPVTAYHGVVFEYATGLTPGARYYASTTAGLLDTATTTGGDVPCAFAVSSTRIHVMSPRK